MHLVHGFPACVGIDHLPKNHHREKEVYDRV
jgi:hypothetical protein